MLSLSLLVLGRQHYRLYTLSKIPTLKVLDFVKVKQSERDRAKRLAMSAAGAALEGDVQIEAQQDAVKLKSKTFNPGEGKSAKESFVVSFSKEQKSKIKEMIAGATSPDEIERIEEFVRRGEFPPDRVLLKHDQAAKRKRDAEGGTNDTNGKTSGESKKMRAQ